MSRNEQGEQAPKAGCGCGARGEKGERHGCGEARERRGNFRSTPQRAQIIYTQAGVGSFVLKFEKRQEIRVIMRAL